jgi:G3E family GTPase
MDKRIPVTLLTGFLGSGKTTLLNQLLPHSDMKDTAVIINELGDAGLDQIFANSHLSKSIDSVHVSDENTVLLDSGCLCCSLQNELADTMRDLFFKRSLQAVPEFKRLVIETTGMADPGPILANLMNEPVIESVYQLDAVVVTIDAVYGLTQLASQAEALKQAAVADVLLITKSDIASKAQVTALQEKLSLINPGATQQLVVNGEISPLHIIDVGLFNMKDQQATPQRWLRAPTQVSKPKGTLPQQPHTDGIQNFTVTLPTGINWPAFKSLLLKLCQTHGEGLLRVKGILHCEDQAHPLAIHAVHFTPYPATPLIDWEEDNPLSRIVVIGKNLDENAIRKMLTQF